MTLYHFFNAKTKGIKKEIGQKLKVYLVREWGYSSDTNNVFKGAIIRPSNFATGDFRLAYDGKLRVRMGCFIHLTCKKKTKWGGICFLIICQNILKQFWIYGKSIA